MLLNEALKSVLLEVGDIGSQTKTGKDGGESNAVTHCCNCACMDREMKEEEKWQGKARGMVVEPLQMGCRKGKAVAAGRGF